MGYVERKAIYRELGEKRHSRVLTFVTGDRKGLETQIASDALDLFGQLLDEYDGCDRLSLVLYTRGGETLTAWSLVNLLREFCAEFEVIVPHKCHSAGTLICLGADQIVMTKQATLGPIDPSVNSPLNPAIPGAPNPAQRLPLSVEDIAAFIQMARKEAGVVSEQYLTTVFTQLAQNIHPIALGNANRARMQIQELAKKLLHLHMDPETDGARITKIVDVLCSEAGSHDYTIYRTEARRQLEMKIESPDETMYPLIRDLYRDISAELQLTSAFNPALVLAGAQTAGGARQPAPYQFTRALIETESAGGFGFLRRGVISYQQLPQGMAIQDEPSVDGWVRFDEDGKYHD